ncbi:MAG: efflux RND transporter periplasmic adaptor subunit [Pseudomonadota bacterium]
MRIRSGLFCRALVLALALPAGAATPGAGSPRPVLTVATVRPVTEHWPEIIPASGGLYAWQEAVIAAEAGGLRITQLHADVGSPVEKGAVLVFLAQDTVRAEIAQQEALIAQARAALAEARANGTRARTLKGGQNLSQQQVDQYLAAEQMALANVSAAEARLQALHIRLDQTRILAPDTGTISARSATLGTVVQTGTEVFRLIRGNRIEWRAEVTGEELARIRPGQPVRLILGEGQSVAGKVRVIAPTLDPGTRRALVYVDLPPESPARAGMFARGEIQFGERPALTLPVSAVILRDGHRYVFETGPDDRVIQHLVVTGRQSGEQVEILTGLAPETRVVVSGGAFLNDGDRVRIESQAGSPP